MDANEVVKPPIGNGQRGIDRCVNSNYTWTSFRRCMNTLVHSLIAVCVFVTIWFAFKPSFDAFHLHIILCVIGYQLLMANGILCLDGNGWSLSLKLVHRRRIHWLLQAIGSLLAIVGSVLMIQQKSSNFNSTHGKFALAALIMTCFSLLNGVTSLYRTTFQRILPFEILKISHLFCGAAAFTASSICLCLGFIKDSFKQWSSQQTQYVMIGIVSIYTGIIVSNPYWKILRKLAKAKKIKNC